MVGRLRLVVMFGLATMVGVVVAMLASAAGQAHGSQVTGDLGIVAGTMRAVQPGSATASPLGAYGVAVDASGNLYIADALNNEVEKVTPSGTLSIVAGTGTRGTPTAGAATSSKLNAPSGVAVDSSGNVYIADAGNDEVEKVTAGGALSVIAGTGTAGAPIAGSATASKLDQPSGVAVDSSGNVYIADTDNDDVEEVSDGQLSIVAGTGSYGEPTTGTAAGTAQASDLGHPSGVAVNSSGDVYIADSGNSLVEEVTPAGALSIVAGVPDANYSGSPTSGASATSSKLDYPTGVAVDASGHVYIADRSDEQVMEVSGGILTIVAGNGDRGAPTPGTAATSDLNDPYGVAVDSGGDEVYIADYDNSEVEKVSGAQSSISAGNGTLSVFAGTAAAGAPTPGTATSSTLDRPYGVAVDSSGDIYIADTDNNEVEKITPSGTLSIIAGNGTEGAPTAGTATSSKLDHPAAVAVDSSGDVYIADAGYFGSDGDVLKVTPAGQLSVIAGTGAEGAPTAGTATSSKLGSPSGVAVDSAGNVYIADTSNAVIEKISGGTLSIFAGEVGVRGTPTSGATATSSELEDPVGVAVDSSGDVYIADEGNDQVYEVKGGTLSVVAGTPNSEDDDVVAEDRTPASVQATSSELDYPSAVAVDSSGNVYIADSGDHEVDKVTPSGTLSIFAGTGAAGLPSPGPATASNLGFPSGLAVDSSGDVFIADQNNNDVEEVFGAASTTTTTGTTTTGTTPPTAAVAYIASVRTNAATTTLTLGCTGASNETCEAKVTLTTSYKVRVGHRTRTKTATIATATVTIAGGKSRAVTVALNRTGSTLLKHDKKLTAQLVVKQGTQVIGTRTVHLAAPRSKR